MFELFSGDCTTILQDYEEKIDLVVTSPPYDDAREYGGHKFRFHDVAGAIEDALKPGGILCWVVQDTIKDGAESLTSALQKVYFGNVLKMRVRTLIYQKPNFSHPNNSWYHNVFEYIFVCSKGKPRCWNPIKDRPNIYAGQIGSRGRNTASQKDGSKIERPRKVNTEFGKRHNIWKGPTRGQEDFCKKQIHPAPMPRWLARDLILSFSNEGDLVLDPMCGGFTVGQEAVKLRRNAIGIEIHEPYIFKAQAEILQLTRNMP